MRHRRWAVFFGVALAILGCGGSSGSSGSSGGPRKPDTGYGAGETPPATENCQDLCQRLGDCGAHLCDEDSMSLMYAGIGDLLATECESSCSDAEVQMAISHTQWQCFFVSSCRQVFDYDACSAMASYRCQ
jgi:hypothetical protein